MQRHNPWIFAFVFIISAFALACESKPSDGGGGGGEGPATQAPPPPKEPVAVEIVAQKFGIWELKSLGPKPTHWKVRAGYNKDEQLVFSDRIPPKKDGKKKPKKKTSKKDDKPEYSTLPVGTRITMGGEEGVLNDAQAMTWSTPAPFAPRLASAPPTMVARRGRGGQMDFGKATLEIPGHKPVELVLDKIAVPSVVLAAALIKVKEGPLLFEGETPDAPLKDTLVLVDPEGNFSNYTEKVVFGDAETLGEVRWIAIKSTESKTKTCKGYKEEGKKKKFSIELEIQTARVHVYERRTGAMIKEKLLKPTYGTDCPIVVMAGKKEKKVVYGKTILKWAEKEHKALVKKKK